MRQDSLNQMENELRAAKEAAEAANLAKTNFLANISHEIRTPLGAVIGYTDMLLSHSEQIPAELHSYLEIIRRNGSHLQSLIDDLLDLSKIETGQLDISKEMFSIRQAVTDVMAVISKSAREKGIRVVVEYLGLLPEKMYSDQRKVRQILINLLGNGVKFTDKGHVTLTIMSDGAESLLFRIKDSGQGIASEDQQKIFEPFIRGHQRGERLEGGTGLGLALSRALAQRIGGDLSLVESSIGGGSVFEFKIKIGDIPDLKWIDYNQPLNQEEVQVRAQIPAFFAERLKNFKILVAEDSRDLAFLVKTYLEGAGAEVTVCFNGRDAVNYALRETFDLLIMDVQMPIKDGYAATRELREKGYACPIIALTAHALMEDKMKSEEAGCSDYITKPVTRKILIQAVERWLSH
jgi:CheY-like chemotaxis protein